jgi:hypothetical protein
VSDIKISGPADVKEVSDLIIGSFDEQIRVYAGYEENVASIKAEISPISIDEYQKAYIEDLDDSADPFSEEAFRADYDRYVKELQDELKDSLQEVYEEYSSIKGAVVMTKPGRHGYFEFAMCRYPTEDAEETVQPYEWRSRLIDGHGKTLALSYGSYYMAEGGSNAREMPYLADIYSSQELQVVSKYLERLSEEADEECGDEGIGFDKFDLADMQLEAGGIFLVQYLKRDLTRIDLKGVGFEVLRYAVECIRNQLDEDMAISVGVFYNLYMQVDTSYLRDPTPNFIKKLNSFVEGVNCISGVELIDFWNDQGMSRNESHP